MLQPIGKIMEVSIERSFDVMEKSWEERVFIKLFISLRTSGLLKTLPAELLQTLICLSTFMDANGKCYPTQTLLASALGITRKQVNVRLKKLCDFSWQGKPLVLKKNQGPDNEGRFRRNVYTILPCTGLSIFNGESRGQSVDNPSKKSAVSPPADRAGGYTNYNHSNNKITNNVNGRKKLLRPPIPHDVKTDPLAVQLARDMEDSKSLPYYRKLVKEVDPYILLKARGEALEEPDIKKSKGALFTFLVKKSFSTSKEGPIRKPCGKAVSASI